MPPTDDKESAMFPSPMLRSSLLLALLGLAGCVTVGPDYGGAPDVASDALNAKSFARAPANGVAAQAPVAAWWQALDDAQLDELIEAALSDSPDLHAAKARLRQSRASLSQQQAQGLPTIGGMAAAAALQTGPGTDQQQTTELYIGGFDASWEADLFGGTRRAVEAASAESEAVDADLADVQVSLAAEVANAYVELRAQQQRRLLLRQTVAYEKQMLALTQQRRERGVATASEVEQMASQLQGSQATLNQIDAAIAASLDQLALLTGRTPGALDGELAAPKALPRLPQTVAIGDPADLLKHRPDIRAAERRLASSNAQIGEKTAAYFPKLTLFGNIGFSADDPTHLIRASNATLIGVPYLSWNFFDFGRTKAAVRGAEAGRDVALAKYEGTVLGALRDANTSLSRYGYQRDSVVKLLAQQASARHMTELTQQRRKAGTASLIELLDAQRSLCAVQQNTIEGQAELLKDFVSLQKSLGLGWRAAS
jgi:NodT family efflux transporter outer membrane factor (OMF) lipoprotein